MNVEYVGKGITISDKTKAFAQTKLAKIFKFLDEPIEARLVIEPGKAGLGADLHIAHRHGVVQSEEEAVPRLEDAIQAVAVKAEKQARRSRKRFIDVRRRAGRAASENPQWPVEVLDGTSLRQEHTTRIIKVQHFSIKPMEVDEAALALEGAKNDFIVFRQTTSDQVSVLFRRRDGNFGLISPEL